MDNREEIIIKYIKNKNVLDLGVGDTSDRFLHKFIKDNAKSVIGVELDTTRAKKLQKKGYNIIIGDAESININKQFDVIIAGDIIEHLNNPGLFLENVKKHLKKEGTFICNTPNIYSFNFAMRSLIQGGNVKHLDEHTPGFTEQLLNELFSRHNLRIKTTIYFSHKEKTIGSLVIRTAGKLRKKWNENIIVIAEKK